MFINNIHKNLSLLFLPSDIKLAWKAKYKKQRELTKKSTFFHFFVFFLKIQDIRKSKTPFFKRGLHKNFLGQVLTIFQTSPMIEFSPIISQKLQPIFEITDFGHETEIHATIFPANLSVKTHFSF